jgi:hypothetical protein
VIETAKRSADGQIAAAHAAIAVKDTGKGMPPDVVRRALEPFFTTRGETGTGLGLAQVQSLARQWGGYVAIDSTPGKGTTVTRHLAAATRPWILPERGGVFSASSAVAPASSGASSRPGLPAPGHANSAPIVRIQKSSDAEVPCCRRAE